MATQKKRTILIVEDEVRLLEVLRIKFEHEGFSVAEAKDGKEGLSMAMSRHPDLILLDIIMPKMDGMTMLTMLRKDAWGRGVPVILLTNLSDNEKVAGAMQSGVYDYLVKSDWKMDDVVAKVKEKLKM